MRNAIRLFCMLVGVALLAIFALPADTAQAQACPSGNWTGSFFNTTDIFATTTPVDTVCRDRIDFDWGGGAPLFGVAADNFSTEWTTTRRLPTVGTDQFSVTVEDGARLFVNQAPVITGPMDVDFNAPRTLTGFFTTSVPCQQVNIFLETVHFTGNVEVELMENAKQIRIKPRA
ncbi:MAG: PA14 domain-containing protein [Anaerolineales bacterium]